MQVPASAGRAQGKWQESFTLCCRNPINKIVWVSQHISADSGIPVFSEVRVEACQPAGDIARRILGGGSLPLRYSFAMGILLCAALLEAAGDAFMRVGLRSPTHIRAALFFVLGGLVLASYGYVVNTPAWDFGRLIGVYVSFFFIMAQLISWFAFGQKPTPMLLLGGALIIMGGCVVSLAR